MDHEELYGVGVPYESARAFLGSDYGVVPITKNGQVLAPNGSFFVYTGPGGSNPLGVTLRKGMNGDRVYIVTSAARNINVSYNNGNGVRTKTIVARAADGTIGDTVVCGRFIFYDDGWYPLV